MPRFSLRFTEPPLDLLVVVPSSSRRKKIIDPNSPVFGGESDSVSEACAFVKTKALQPSDAVELVYSHAFRKSIVGFTHDSKYYPMDLIVSRGESTTTCTPKKRKERPDASTQKKKTKSVEVICLDDTDEEAEETQTTPQEEKVVPAVSPDISEVDTIQSPPSSQDDMVTVPMEAPPDPVPSFKRGAWIITNGFGPARVISSRTVRHATSPCHPRVLYLVRLQWGRMYTYEVDSLLEESDYGKIVVAEEPSLITNYDLVRLWPKVYLNERLVEFYLKHILQQPGQNYDVYLYSTYFYSKIALHSKRKRLDLWNSLQRWTKNVDIWSKRLLLIPIHDKLHWSLAVVVMLHPAPPIILHLDSGKRFQLHNSRTVSNRLRAYLHAMSPDTKLPEIQASAPEVPQQANAVDCGLFMLEFVERIVVQQDLENFATKGKKAPLNKNWFDVTMISKNKRGNIEQLIREKEQERLMKE